MSLPGRKSQRGQGFITLKDAPVFIFWTLRQVRVSAAAALPHPGDRDDDGVRTHLAGALPRHQVRDDQQEEQPR